VPVGAGGYRTQSKELNSLKIRVPLEIIWCRTQLMKQKILSLNQSIFKNYTSNLYLLLLYMNNWTQSVNSLLDKIRLNSFQLTNKHIQNHLYYKFL